MQGKGKIFMMDIATMENLVKDYPDNKEAWEKVSDMLCDEQTFRFNRVYAGKDEEEYLKTYYPKVRVLAEIAHVMATVPIYVLVEKQSDNTCGMVGIVPSNNRAATPIIPVYFSKDSAENGKRHLKGKKSNVYIVKTLFCMLVDCTYAVMLKEENINFTFVDERPDHRWATLSKTQIFEIVFDANKAIFGDYESYLIPDDWNEYPDEEALPDKVQPREKTMYPVWDSFHKKPPVS